MAIQRMKPITVVNISGEHRKFRIDHELGVEPDIHNLAPGESVQVPGAYAARRQTAPGREILPSIIENLTGGMVVGEYDPRAKAILEQQAAQRAAAAAEAKSSQPQGKRAG
jgi:hypothetical protein